jgi:CheY-like chemotaxis protein
MASDRPRQRSRPPRVLIVDGHDDTCELYAVGLAFFGFETVTIEDGAYAFRRARETRPDIIVTEIALPRRDGWTLVDDLKHDPQTSAIPVVVLTTYSEPSVRERAEREGCAAVFVKPYLPEQLAPVLRELLEMSVPG